MDGNEHALFSAYLILNETPPPAARRRRILEPPAAKPNGAASDGVEESMQAELQVSRRYCVLREKVKLHQGAEERNYEEAKSQGLLQECGCCCTETPLNRMVACTGDPMHLFCVECFRKLAETQIGQSRYLLQCMSINGCSAVFSSVDSARFLDDGLVTALDRIEQEAVLRSANIDNLAACPFCPFAAECRPVEEDREFRCQDPDCGIVSCRLCKTETHVPLSCAEAAEKMGNSARQQIEEAMSAAMIRKCNQYGGVGS
ncbi:hypothetical protein Trco_001721 [Trichoderma cornu-damae]|uniref:RING-type domain-containing protein n=1 Tax=Trichoderma cornu-damae TaxID=654480 RepID=A0A9P8QL97_9HYPO|nr:hypothetical protein Trco_001721 [Trichoderma cornu-damae]